MDESARFLPEELSGIVTLRQPRHNDAERLLGYFESLGEASRAFSYPHPFDRENAVRICTETSRSWFRMVAETIPVGGVSDAECRIVGLAWFAPWRDHLCPTLGIGISDDFQGRRLGRALMDALIREANDRGLPGLRLSVYPQNERAMRLYSSRGFRIVGKHRQEHVMELVFDKTRGDLCESR